MSGWAGHGTFSNNTSQASNKFIWHNDDFPADQNTAGETINDRVFVLFGSP
jgi:hypothetical protein